MDTLAQRAKAAALPSCARMVTCPAARTVLTSASAVGRAWTRMYVSGVMVHHHRCRGDALDRGRGDMGDAGDAAGAGGTVDGRRGGMARDRAKADGGGRAAVAADLADDAIGGETAGADLGDQRPWRTDRLIRGGPRAAIGASAAAAAAPRKHALRAHERRIGVGDGSPLSGACRNQRRDMRPTPMSLRRREGRAAYELVHPYGEAVTANDRLDQYQDHDSQKKNTLNSSPFAASTAIFP